MRTTIATGAAGALVLSAVLFLLFIPADAPAQGQGRDDRGYVDDNGDGMNDNAGDHDGDGIPNGQDPDYDGQNPMRGNGRMGFVDEDGDGINDRCLDDDGDGIPNGRDPDFEPPKDGTGRKFRHGHGGGEGGGRGGSGECDGTGPRGAAERRGGRG